MSSPLIRTARLTLSPLRPADAPALAAYRADPEVCRYQNFAPGSLADAAAFIDGLADAFDTPSTWFQFGLRLQDGGELIGDLGAHFLAPDGRQVEFGITVAPAHQGRGLGVEAVGGLLDHLFGVLGKHRVVASVDPRNAPSLALVRRLGLRQEAHFRQSLWFQGQWVDDLVFAILAEEWRRSCGND